jgi:hypothetical protein
MDEITLRLPSETTAALQSEADQRGVSLESHLRAIVEAYRADDERGPRPAVEYVHTVADRRSSSDRNRTSTTSEEIGSFRYGSRSVLSE